MLSRACWNYSEMELNSQMSFLLRSEKWEVRGAGGREEHEVEEYFFTSGVSCVLSLHWQGLHHQPALHWRLGGSTVSPLLLLQSFSLVHSHWSRNVKAWLSLFESFIELKYFYGVATPALVCHKEPARWGYFACFSLVLYCIRELA